MNIERIDTVLTTEPAYRKKQVYKLLFDELINSWNKATILPQKLRGKLEMEVPLVIKAKNVISKNDQTVKALITLTDGLKIETVLMRYKNRNTVCVSSQVGCALGCRFCATGKMGFRRNLTTGEILDQVLYFARMFNTKPNKKKITNIVFMGMGEPLLNYNNVIKAIKILNSQNGMHIGARKISISTSGIVEGINKLIKEPLEINLALSLHAAHSNLRSKLMPINRKYPLSQVMESIHNYLRACNRKVMIEYILLQNVNDSDNQAKDLVNLLLDNRHLYHVNLIQYNPTGSFKASTKERIKSFIHVLEQHGISVSKRYRLGRDINASCGQLALKKNE